MLTAALVSALIVLVPTGFIVGWRYGQKRGREEADARTARLRSLQILGHEEEPQIGGWYIKMKRGFVNAISPEGVDYFGEQRPSEDGYFTFDAWVRADGNEMKPDEENRCRRATLAWYRMRCIRNDLPTDAMLPKPK